MDKCERIVNRNLGYCLKYALKPFPPDFFLAPPTDASANMPTCSRTVRTRIRKPNSKSYCSNWNSGSWTRSSARIVRKFPACSAEGFREFGSSGRVWSRDQILNPSETRPPAPLVEDFAVNTIVPELVQVTYRTLKTIPGGKPQAALRSSLWIRRGDRWQMLFHQGTRIPDV